MADETPDEPDEQRPAWWDVELRAKFAPDAIEVRRCENETEPDGILCTGLLAFGPPDLQARCSMCGAWEGVRAPGASERRVGVLRAAARPAAVADQAGDVYEAAARLTLTGMGEHNPGETVLTAWTGDSAYRYGVDAGRVPLLAELATIDDMIQSTARFADIGLPHGTLGVQRLLDVFLGLIEELAEARAKVAEREPKWGVRTTWDGDTADMWHPDRRDADRHIADARRDGIQVTLIRQWRGPVEAVGDGSGT